MMTLEATFIAEPLQRALREAPGAVFDGFKDGLSRVLNGFRKEFLEKSPAHLSRGRFGLLNKKQWPVETKGASIDDLQGVLYTTSQAAHLLEKGGTVRAKDGGPIALPIGGALNKSGTARLPGYSSPTAARQKRGSIFVTYVTKRGTKLLLEVRRGGKRQRGTIAAFVLVPSISTKPVLGLFAAWSAHGKDDVLRRLGLSLNKALRAAGLPPTGVPTSGIPESVGA